MNSFGPHAFYIVPSQVSSSKITFSFAYTAPIWTKIRFNFWASAHNEIQLGNFNARNIQSQGNAAVVSTTIQKAFAPSDSPVIRAFINGYMVGSNGVQVAVNPNNLEGTTLSIKIMLGPTTQISSIWLSYIAFSPVTSSFVAYGGSLMKSKFSGS